MLGCVNEKDIDAAVATLRRHCVIEVEEGEVTEKKKKRSQEEEEPVPAWARKLQKTMDDMALDTYKQTPEWKEVVDRAVAAEVGRVMREMFTKYMQGN